MRAVLVVALLAGCAAAPAPVAEEAVQPPVWSAGHWWRYEVRTGDATVEATLVYDGQRLLITDRELGRELSRQKVPLLAGTFEDGTWSGSFWGNNIFSPVEEAVEFEWFRWPVNETPKEDRRARGYGTGGTVGALEVLASNETHATFAYSGPVAGSAVYDARIGWMESMEFLQPVPSTWRLLKHGEGHQGPAWLVEHRSEDRTVIGVSSYEISSRGGNVLVVDYRLDCPRPGAFDLRISPNRPDPSPYIWYTDACPASLHRVESVEATFPEWVGYEVTGAMADTTLWGGHVAVIFLHEEAV